MTAIVYLIALLGCGEGEAPCQRIALLETSYENRVECMAAVEAVLAGSRNDDYPIVVAQCHEAGTVPEVHPQELIEAFRF